MIKSSHSMVLVEPNKFESQILDIPPIGDEDLLMKVEMVGICGTDKSLYLGNHEQKHYPMLMGHEVVGYVEQIGFKAKQSYNLQVGDRITVEPFISCNKCVYCIQGHYQLCVSKTCYGLTRSIKEAPFLNGAYSQYLFILPNSKVHKIKKDVSSKAACMSSVIGNGVRWVKTKGQVKAGENVVIIGPGAQGLSSTIIAKSLGANPILIGLQSDTDRLNIGKELGATHTLVLGKDDIEQAVHDFTQGLMADVVIDCSGAESALQLAVKLARPLGKVVIIGKNGGKYLSIMTDKIVNKELEIIGGYGQAGDVEYAVDIINSNKYNVEKIVSHVFKLEDAEEAMALFLKGSDQCVRIALEP